MGVEVERVGFVEELGGFSVDLAVAGEDCSAASFLHGCVDGVVGCFHRAGAEAVAADAVGCSRMGGWTAAAAAAAGVEAFCCCTAGVAEGVDGADADFRSYERGG